MLYLILEIFLVLFFALPFAVSGIVFALEQVDGWMIGSAVFLAISALIFWGVYKLDRKRRSKLLYPQQEQQIIQDIRTQALIDESNRALEKIQQAKQHLEEETQQLQLKRESLKEEIESLCLERTSLAAELEAIERKSIIPLSHPEADYDAFTSDELKNQLIILRGQQDNMVRTGAALSITNTGARTVVNSQVKQILRCFNAECTNILDHLSVKNVDSSRNKIQRAFESNNRIFSIDGVQLTHDYLAAKLDELTAIYAYLVKVEEEKEEKRAIREQMLEEEKVRREIEREKKKIERDRQQFNQEIQRLMKYMQKTESDIEKQLYIDKIRELEDRLHALESTEKEVLERENNAKAGFVYIISNIGSFGDQVFKIGMTRRLEPMDRIAELSSASVPFPFDVHAMIFSENAPELEAMLHRHFESRKVNKVNSRKEFFRIDLDEIKQLILDQFGATVQFTDIPIATEYRETLRLEKSAE